ncbi:14-3-3-like protein G-BOX factor 14 kappa isoform X2 [Elaeis guineensis]|uniref:14-3-3-like protein GF14 kappa isoform X2 n=1 Tax=Elaeis guineensis var. tenera TaxID=51953 RepID=A0A6I9SGV6_ELAGV|nr:14-3-3-like protein GF14 kappa isoform X2 [Elaeis guineensis]
MSSFVPYHMEFEEPLTREEYVFLAKLCERAERYDEMVGFLDKMVLGTSSLGELTVEERSLLCMAYKGLVCSPREAWRVISFIEKNGGCRHGDHATIIKAYRARLEADIASICGRILGLLDSHLNLSACSIDSKVFFLKMKGDYHRYLAEFKVEEERNKAIEDAMAAYKEAEDIALADLAPTHALRLGVALNFSVFYYEILNSTEKASRMAKRTWTMWMTSPTRIVNLFWSFCKTI